jgi:hypothetical protein
MKTHYEDHKALSNEAALLRLMATCWQTKQNRNPLKDYEQWEEKCDKSKRLMTKSDFYCFIGLLLMVLSPIFLHELRWLSAWVLCALILFRGLFILLKANKIYPEGLRPVIWDEYQEDLNIVIDAFALDGSETLENLWRMINEELTIRGHQIAAKQKAGYGVDARTERRNFVKIYDPTYKFGLAKEINHYFSKSEK